MGHNKPVVTRTIMLMTQGVKQGGVFSNLLYSLTTLPVLEAARAHSWMTTAFLDDMSVSIVSTDDVSILFNSITPVLQQLGLQINIAKCKVGLLSKVAAAGRPDNQPYRANNTNLALVIYDHNTLNTHTNTSTNTNTRYYYNTYTSLHSYINMTITGNTLICIYLLAGTTNILINCHTWIPSLST